MIARALTIEWLWNPIVFAASIQLAPLWISLKTALAATVFAGILGIVAAQWMYGFKGRSRWLWDGLLTLPLVLPPIVTGFLLLLLLGRNGPMGRILAVVNVQVIFAWPALVIAATVVAFPLVYKTTLAALDQVDETIAASARTLGATDRRVFWQILVPLAWPGIIAGLVLAFARALGEFGATIMVAGSIPGRTETVPIAIYLAAEGGRMGQAILWTVVAVAVALGAIGLIHISGSDRADVGARTVFKLAQACDRWLVRLTSLFARAKPHNPIISKPRSNVPKALAKETVTSELTVNLHKQLEFFPLSIQLNAGDRPFGILGHSGSGKSMTLRCLAGLEPPDRGHIILNGRTLYDSERAIDLPSNQRRIGIVFQHYALFPHMTVADNIAFAIANRAKAPSSPTSEPKSVSHFLSLVKLEEHAHRYPKQLSGGQQQRIALARALASEPEALLLDEPLSALDNYLRSQIEQLLIDLFASYRGSVIVVTHKLEEAYRVCDRLMVLDDGQVLANGPKAAIFEQPGHRQVALVTECKNFSRITDPKSLTTEALDSDRHTVTATDWNVTLRINQSVSPNCTHIGLRAHHLKFQTTMGENIFPCWLVGTSEMQHRVSLFLKLHSPPTHPKDYHLRAELYKDRWKEQQQQPFPWYIYLDPERIMPLHS